MIDKLTVDRIYATADIVEVIGEFVQLKKRGASHIGRCPFHDEKTPSFNVSQSKGIYKCFGCGKSGNVVGFLMEHENLTYPEALRYLGRKYHIEIEETQPSAEAREQESRREALQAVTSFAAEWFRGQMNGTDEGRGVGLGYFRERGFTDAAIERFQLGYSPNDRQALAKAAQAKGYKPDILTESGLCVVSSVDGTLRDRFARRVIFPIHGATGNVIGFAGRTMTTEKSTPKYLNSPETQLYSKSFVLFGLFQARRAIAAHDRCFLVEGYTDVISLHQAGIENVVASSGTSLTQDQIRLIRRYTQNLTVLYDGDMAGIKASLRGIDMILAQGLNVKVVLLPDGEDPDSFARRHNAQELTEYIKSAETDFIRFKINLMSADAQGDPIKKAALISDIVRSIAQIPDLITRSVYAKEAAQLMAIDERVVASAIADYVKQHVKSETERHAAAQNAAAEGQPAADIGAPAAPPAVAPAEVMSESRRTELELVRMLVENGDKVAFVVPPAEGDDPSDAALQTVGEFIIEELERDRFQILDPELAKIHAAYLDALRRGVRVSSLYFTQSPDLEVSRIAAELFAPTPELSRIWEKKTAGAATSEELLARDVRRIVYEYKWRRIRVMQNEIKARLLSPSLSDDEWQRLAERQLLLDRIKARLSSELGGRAIL